MRERCWKCGESVDVPGGGWQLDGCEPYGHIAMRVNETTLNGLRALGSKRYLVIAKEKKKVSETNEIGSGVKGCGLGLDPNHEDDYPGFLAGIQKTFDERAGDRKEWLFQTTADLWGMFLYNLPTGMRQHYTCNECRRFVQRWGGLAVITPDGTLKSALWAFDNVPAVFRRAVTAMETCVELASVIDVGQFPVKLDTLGTPATHGWRHMSVRLPAKVAMNVEPLRERHTLLTAALGKYSKRTVETVLNLLRAQGLYRGAGFVGMVEWFLKLCNEVAGVKDLRRVDRLIWYAVAHAPSPEYCFIKNSVVGSLLNDIESGRAVDLAVKSFDEKMSPLQYRRPQVAPAGGNIEEAERLVAKLGIERSLPRRFARLDEIPERLWMPSDRAVEERGRTGVFAALRSGPPEPSHALTLGPQRMTFRKFAREIMPSAHQLQCRVTEGANPFIVITTAVHYDAPPILKWDRAEGRNTFAHYVYVYGARALSFGLHPGFIDVTTVTVLPRDFGRGRLLAPDTGAIFLLKGAVDRGEPGVALFPEDLRSDLHPIRSTIEAYSRKTKMAGIEMFPPIGQHEAACGLVVGGGHQASITVRAVVGNVVTMTTIDSWD